MKDTLGGQFRAGSSVQEFAGRTDSVSEKEFLRA